MNAALRAEIAGRLQAEQLLAESKEKCRTFLESMDDSRRVEGIE
jgi:hypothetical protein